MGSIVNKNDEACGNSISLPLKLIFQSMINEGVFPEY